jgi:hypothetical protein
MFNCSATENAAKRENVLQGVAVVRQPSEGQRLGHVGNVGKRGSAHVCLVAGR